MEGDDTLWSVLLNDYPSKLVMMYSLTGEVLRVSEQSQSFLGIPAAMIEQARMNVGTIMHREDVPLVFKCFTDLVESGEGTTVDLYHRVFSDLGRSVVVDIFSFFPLLTDQQTSTPTPTIITTIIIITLDMLSSHLSSSSFQ
jgi:hypothetical protein